MLPGLDRRAAGLRALEQICGFAAPMLRRRGPTSPSARRSCASGTCAPAGAPPFVVATCSLVLRLAQAFVLSPLPLCRAAPESASWARPARGQMSVGSSYTSAVVSQYGSRIYPGLDPALANSCLELTTQAGQDNTCSSSVVLPRWANAAPDSTEIGRDPVNARPKFEDNLAREPARARPAFGICLRNVAGHPTRHSCG